MEDLAVTLARVLQARNAKVATAESCTGGWLAKRITDVAGSSAWFDQGFITYSNDAKQELLGVSGATLEMHGAVSEPTVREMAEGMLGRGGATVTAAITGVAGPSGGSEDKPVGTVWLAWAMEGKKTLTTLRQFSGDRENVRRAAVRTALEGLIGMLD